MAWTRTLGVGCASLSSALVLHPPHPPSLLTHRASPCLPPPPPAEPPPPPRDYPHHECPAGAARPATWGAMFVRSRDRQPIEWQPDPRRVRPAAWLTLARSTQPARRGSQPAAGIGHARIAVRLAQPASSHTDLQVPGCTPNCSRLAVIYE